jgi:para-aminobenzoate synthetase component 1
MRSLRKAILERVPATSHTELALREVPAPPTWRDLVESLRETEGFWLLESTRAGGPLGRFSFAGAAPERRLCARGDRIEIEEAGARRVLRGDPLEHARALLGPPAPADAGTAIPFVGGAVGWIGYELGARAGGAPPRAPDDLGLPELELAFVDRLLAFEHASGRLHAAALGRSDDRRSARARAARAAERLAGRLALGALDPFEAGPRRAPTPGGVGGTDAEPLRLRDAATGLELGAWFDADAYAKAVLRIQERIAAGDLYQANLTHRLALERAGDPWRIYTELRRINPAPFAAFLETGELAVVGSSPERFLRVAPDGAIESRPIKGTRPRGATPAEDERLRAALAASEKDRAENVMIVDLVRNDLGRVCQTGSVEVPALFAIEDYATVFQMVSTVRGRLRPGLGVFDALRAAFPPGSMTGAPKRAAMRLLAELEPVRRGVYSGALGWLDARGGAELAVVIRTLLCRGGRAWLHVGGGVVLDSDPEGEWAEALDKARALLDALAAAGS